MIGFAPAWSTTSTAGFDPVEYAALYPRKPPRDDCAKRANPLRNQIAGVQTIALPARNINPRIVNSAIGFRFDNARSLIIASPLVRF